MCGILNAWSSEMGGLRLRILVRESRGNAVETIIKHHAAIQSAIALSRIKEHHAKMPLRRYQKGAFSKRKLGRKQ